MTDEVSTQNQFVNELTELRKRIAELQKSETLRNQTEEALREAEMKYRGIFENAVEGIFQTSPDGHFLAINPALARMLGYASPKELMAEVTDARQFFIDPQRRQEFIRLMQANGVVVGFENQVRRKDGSTIWVSENVRTLRDSAGRLAGYEGMAVDITERKRADEALLKSEKRYRSLFEDSPISLWEEDFSDIKKYIDGLRACGVNDFRIYFNNHPEDIARCARMVKVVDINKATLELYRAESKEELLLNLRKIFRDGSDEAFREELIAIAEGKPRFEIEANSQTLRNEKKHIVLRWSAAADYEAMWSKVLVSVVDLTERKRIEEAQRESEIRLRSIAQSAPDAIISADSDDNIISWNKGAQTIFGYGEEEALGKPLTMIMPERYRDDHKKGMERVNSTGEERIIGKTVELVGLRKDGSEFPLELSLSTWKTEKERLFSGIIRDVTWRKRAEEKLKQTLAELERSNKDLEQFAYVASHDLQEPLRTVSNFSQLLAKRYKGELDAKADQFIGFIVDGAARMQQMIDDLLVYSRVSTRAKPFEPTNCEIILNQALANLKMAIEESKATVIHDALPIVLADASQMAQLFQNLISNAIKFRREKPRIMLSADLKGNEWQFSVQDNGIGIAPEFMEHIFKMFQREHASAEYPGTGVGLAICKKIVERHGGRIWVKSEQSRGSTFYFTIPAKRVE